MPKSETPSNVPNSELHSVLPLGHDVDLTPYFDEETLQKAADTRKEFEEFLLTEGEWSEEDWRLIGDYWHEKISIPDIFSIGVMIVTFAAHPMPNLRQMDELTEEQRGYLHGASNNFRGSLMVAVLKGQIDKWNFKYVEGLGPVLRPEKVLGKDSYVLHHAERGWEAVSMKHINEQEAQAIIDEAQELKQQEENG